MSRGSFLSHLAGFVILTGGLIFLALVRVSMEGPVVCTFKRISGLGCPGCGITRSLSATMHLDLGRAFQIHAFGPPIVAIGLAAWAMLGWSLLTRRSIMPDPNSRWLALSAVGVGLAMVAYWIVRLAMGAVP